MGTILVTGGAGFIGSHVIKHFVHHHSQRYHVVNLDKLTYAGNLGSLRQVENSENYTFRKGDICDRQLVDSLFKEFDFSRVVHLAAESHVDRSIDSPGDFIATNVLGTMSLLDAARSSWKDDFTDRTFCHVSTDEVYGSLGATGLFSESTAYSPQSPYAASKASADHLVRAYHNTYGLPVKITNCSNNYGSHQFPEKLIPLCISRIWDREPIPVYGDGSNIRDWLYVTDHVRALDAVLHNGTVGESYNIGGNSEVRNIDLVRSLCQMADELLAREKGSSEELITFVADRPGHDFRYAVDFSKIKNELGWNPTVTFEEGLRRTLSWYLENQEWVADVKSGAYRQFAHKAVDSA